MEKDIHCNKCGQELKANNIVFGIRYHCVSCDAAYDIKFKHTFLVIAWCGGSVAIFTGIMDYFKISFLASIPILMLAVIIENIIIYLLTPFFLKIGWMKQCAVENKGNE